MLVGFWDSWQNKLGKHLWGFVAWLKQVRTNSHQLTASDCPFRYLLMTSKTSWSCFLQPMESLLSSVLDHWLTLDLWPLQQRLYLYHCLSCDVCCLGFGEAVLEVLRGHSDPLNPRWLSESGLEEQQSQDDFVVQGTNTNHRRKDLKTEQANSQSPWCLHFSFHLRELKIQRLKNKMFWV